MKKFKRRYVLGVGYPTYGDAVKIRNYKVMLFTKPRYGEIVELKNPTDLFDYVEKDCPKYRLVLERVK